MERRWASNIMNIRSYKGACCGPEHFLVKANLRRRVMSFRTGGTCTTLTLDIDKLKDKEFHRQFSSSPATTLKSNAQLQIQASEAEVFLEALKKNVKTVAKEVLGTSTKSKAKERFGEECKDVVRTRKEAYHLYLDRPTRSEKQQLDRSINKYTALAEERTGIIRRR
jgi:hypothetical protein